MSISTNNAGSSVVGFDRPLTEGKLATIIKAKHADQNATSAKEVCAAGMTVRSTAVPNPGITAAYVQFRQELKNDTYRFSPAPGKTTFTRLPGRFLPR